jgi:uncharacterized repeat protein (TIGR02543 family)
MGRPTRSVLTLVLCIALSLSGVLIGAPTVRAADSAAWKEVCLSAKVPPLPHGPIIQANPSLSDYGEPRSTHTWLFCPPATTNVFSYWVDVCVDEFPSSPDPRWLYYFAIDAYFSDGGGGAHGGIQWAGGGQKANWGGYNLRYAGDTQSIVVDYPWVVERWYRYRVERQSQKNDGSWTWGFWITDLNTNMERYLGGVSSKGGSITDCVVWMETGYGVVATTTRAQIRWRNPVYAYGDSQTLGYPVAGYATYNGTCVEPHTTDQQLIAADPREWVQLTNAPVRTTPAHSYLWGDKYFALVTASSPSTGGAIIKSPNAASYILGTVVTLTATPAAGYTFAGWFGDLIGTTNPITIAIDANRVVTATFIALSTTCTLTPFAGTGGTITPNTPQTVLWGGSKTFTITPDAGYHILDVTEDAISLGVGDTCLFTNVQADHIIRAVFAPNAYTLTVTPPVNGTVVENPDQPTYPYNSIVTLTATPAAGYTFTGWSGDFMGTLNPGAITMDANKTVTATFTALPTYTLTPSASLWGTITPNTVQTILQGGSATFAMVPTADYHIADVSVDGVSQGVISSYTFTNVTSNHTISARFEQEKKQAVMVLQIGSSMFTINGASRALDSPPVIKNGRTLVPIRAIIEALGGTVGWDGTARKATVTLGSTTIELWIGKSAAKVNGATTPIDAANAKVVPEIISSRTMLPLRFVTETLGATVGWDAATQTIAITYAP